MYHKGPVAPGASTSSMLKSPFGSGKTAPESWATLPQKRVAKMGSALVVPMLPPARIKPSPSTVDGPARLPTRASSCRITHGCPAGGDTQDHIRRNGGALPRTGITPIPPLNLTSVSAPSAGEGQEASHEQYRQTRREKLFSCDRGSLLGCECKPPLGQPRLSGGLEARTGRMSEGHPILHKERKSTKICYLQYKVQTRGDRILWWG